MNETTLWLASRATGLVALGLLTATILLGMGTTGRMRTARLPRFAVADLHRNLSLMAVLFVGVHVVSAVTDPYVPLRWLDVVVPFAAAYQPLWLGLGAVALDLMLAATLTSLIRRWLSHRLWRLVHWSGHLLFPVAVVHAFGIAGIDGKLAWVLVWIGGCAVAVLAAWGLRAAAPVHPDTELRRTAQEPERTR